MSRRTRRWLITGGLSLALLLCAAAALVLRPLSAVDGMIQFRLWTQGVHNRATTVEGRHVHYLEVEGPGGGGRPLLLIHGLGARAQDWAGLMPEIAKAGFHVYAPDLLGYGETDAPDTAYSIGEEERFAMGFARQVHVEHADVAGWSMGGWVAMKLAADHPKMVDRLILYDSAGTYFPRDYDSSIFTPQTTGQVDTLVARLTPRPVHVPGFLARDLLRRAERRDWVIQRAVASMTSGRDLMEFRLYQIRQPTLVVWGTADTLIPFSTGERIARGIAGATLAPIEGCGHLAPMECKSQVLPATLAFLRGEGAVQTVTARK